MRIESQIREQGTAGARLGVASYSPQRVVTENLAKQLALDIQGKIPVK